MSWHSYDRAHHGGVRYGLKSDSFESLMDLPTRSKVKLELAIDDASAQVAHTLEQHGWQVRDGLEVTRDPWTHQRYLQESAGELCVAKEGYVSSRSGWFSERSAAYLASGRPVVAQDTGFTDWLQSAPGLIAFADPEGAATALREMLDDYERHSTGARQLAAEYFDFQQVLPALLERAFSAPRVDMGSWPQAHGDGLSRYRQQVAEIVALVPEQAGFIVVDGISWDGPGVVEGRRWYPFLERDGRCWGSPATDAEAVRDLERLRGEGAAFLFFEAAGFWWLDHYTGFRQHLESNYPSALRSEERIAFDLRGDAKT